MGDPEGSLQLTRTLLIDADIVAYRYAASNEERYDWGDGITSVNADFDAAKKDAAEYLDHLVKELDADDLIICLSDDFRSFRKEDVYPEYKSNRKATVRPEHLYDMKEWLGQAYPTDLRRRLEADDVMGILATEPHKGERVIVSADKDMQTIPALLFNPNKPELKVRRIAPEQAERFMLWQALTGDQTDGYPGCPGVGPKMADKVLDGLMWQRAERELKSGPRKGEKVSEWVSYECGFSTVWERIVAVYEKTGLSESDAIVQVNCARILKHSDVDGNRVIPWSPAGLRAGGD